MSNSLPIDSSPSGPAQDYKDEFELIFQEDVEFSRKFKAQIDHVLAIIRLPRKVDDQEGTPADLDLGFDRILTSDYKSVGIRTRRFRFQDYDNFTQDDKERETTACDLYFHSYANPSEDALYSYIVFDGRDYLKFRDTDKIPCIRRERNQRHSRVWFNCYRNYDIIKHCRVYAKYGDIGWKSDRIFRETCVICGETVMGLNIEPPKGKVAHIACLYETNI